MKKKNYISNKILVFVIIILFLILFINSSTGIKLDKQSIEPNSNGNILYVGGTGPDNYTKISYAIKIASEGDTIFVFDDSSPYNENLVVDKSLNLKGEECKTTIISGAAIYKSTILVTNDWVNISGFTITNGYGGIRINSNNNSITGNIISDNNWGGLSLQIAKYNNITGNKIINNFYGIQLYEKSSYNYISRNIIKKSYHTGIMIGNPIVPLGIFDISLFNFDYSDYNIITENNLINFGGNAFFTGSWKNTWDRNYWNRPRILPKFIVGYKGDLTGRYYNIDWHPALLPYNIEL